MYFWFKVLGSHNVMRPEVNLWYRTVWWQWCSSDVALICHIVSHSDVSETPHFTRCCHLTMRRNKYLNMMWQWHHCYVICSAGFGMQSMLMLNVNNECQKKVFFNWFKDCYKIWKSPYYTGTRLWTINLIWCMVVRYSRVYRGFESMK